MLISMLLVIVGAITIAALPVARFPAIASLGSADPGDLQRDHVALHLPPRLAELRSNLRLSVSV